MRPEAQYLIEISTPSKEFDANRFVNECLNHELQQLRYASISGLLNSFVVSQGYPIACDRIRNSSYVNRPRLEERVERTISEAHNLYLIGCEGGGKTTLLHYVISKGFKSYKSVFAYIDLSDIGGDSEALSDIFYDKMRNSLFLAMSKEEKNGFSLWIDRFKSDAFHAELLNTSSTKRFVESILIYLNSIDTVNSAYIIIDNLDSLKSETVRDFFSLFHRLEGTIVSAFSAFSFKNYERLRFIVCCRTQSVNTVTSASEGLFTKSQFDFIDMDERFTADTDMLSLTHAFIKKEKSFIFNYPNATKVPIRVPASFGSVGWESFDDYAEDVFDWLQRSKLHVLRAINDFCGRSIRRSKLFIIKTLGSPVIARLVFFEKHKIYQIVRDEPEYLVRRMLEAIFDFSVSIDLQMPGYPLNPFRVLVNSRNFRDNPLIGIVALLYIWENFEDLKLEKVHFAQAISASPIVEYLRAMRYDDEAISESIHSMVLCGLLRPLREAKVILLDKSNNEHVVESYIVDDHALGAYIDLILFKKWAHSLTFYNMALRARYNIRSDRHLDNMTYEAYTFLVFLFDLIDREQKLESQIRGSGLMFKPLSARIRSQVLPRLESQIKRPSEIRDARNLDQVRREQADLVQNTRDLMNEARWKLSRHAGIL